VQVLRSPAPAEEQLLGLQGYCHSCGSHRGVSLLHWRELGACRCGAEPVMSGPLWRGPLQDVEVLEQLLALEGPDSALLTPASRRLLQRLQADDGLPAEASDLADLARQLQGGPPKLKDLVARLQQGGWRAQASGIAPGQFRTNAPWPEVFAAAKAG
jgi:tRNA (guanine26-N2/guanine27-N2)-dimethyltransferase